MTPRFLLQWVSICVYLPRQSFWLYTLLSDLGEKQLFSCAVYMLFPPSCDMLSVVLCNRLCDIFWTAVLDAISVWAAHIVSLCFFSFFLSIWLQQFCLKTRKIRCSFIAICVYFTLFSFLALIQAVLTCCVLILLIVHLHLTALCGQAWQKSYESSNHCCIKPAEFEY